MGAKIINTFKSKLSYTLSGRECAIKILSRFIKDNAQLRKILLIP